MPDEPVSHYNLGYLYRLTDKPADALGEFEPARGSTPNLAGPHFQLYNAYRPRAAPRKPRASRPTSRRSGGGRRARPCPKTSTGASTPRSGSAEPANANDDAAPVALRLRDLRFRAERCLEGRGLMRRISTPTAEPIWSPGRRRAFSVFKNGDTPIENAGPRGGSRPCDSSRRGTSTTTAIRISASMTDAGRTLYRNASGRFRAGVAASLPAGPFTAAVWARLRPRLRPRPAPRSAIRLRLLRNNGAGRLQRSRAAVSASSPGQATGAPCSTWSPTRCGTRRRSSTYADRPAVIYRDLLGGKFERDPSSTRPPARRVLVAVDLDHDGTTDVFSAARAA